MGFFPKIRSRLIFGESFWLTEKGDPDKTTALNSSKSSGRLLKGEISQ